MLDVEDADVSVIGGTYDHIENVKYASMNIEKMSLGDVESAYASAAMMNKIMFDKKKQMQGEKNEEQKEQTVPETSEKS